VGTVFGLAGAWFLVRVLQGLVYGVVARDPFSFLIAPLILLGIAVLAALVPSRMAARVEPLEALRAE
jgi:ABC-type antimicrobial peptide transport system permease subunit